MSPCSIRKLWLIGPRISSRFQYSAGIVHVVVNGDASSGQWAAD